MWSMQYLKYDLHLHGQYLAYDASDYHTLNFITQNVRALKQFYFT
jgi:hypothetical protein